MADSLGDCRGMTFRASATFMSRVGCFFAVGDSRYTEGRTRGDQKMVSVLPSTSDKTPPMSTTGEDRGGQRRRNW
jgi:hypothetical protein